MIVLALFHHEMTQLDISQRYVADSDRAVTDDMTLNIALCVICGLAGHDKTQHMVACCEIVEFVYDFYRLWV